MKVKSWVKIVLVLAMCFFGASHYSRAQSLTPSNKSADPITADINGSAEFGAPDTSGLKVNGKPTCTYGNTYRYVLANNGWLLAQSDIVCPTKGLFVTSGQTVCTDDARAVPELPAFDKNLTCIGKTNLPSGGGTYKIDERGVTVNGTFYAWTNSQQVPALIAKIRKKTGG